MDKISEEDISQLLSHTKGLLNHVYWVQQKFQLQPDNEHTATSINYNDY